MEIFSISFVITMVYIGALSAVWTLSKYFGVFPVKLSKESGKFVVSKRAQLFSTVILIICYCIDLLKMAQLFNLFIKSHFFLATTLKVVANINCMLNFYFIFIVIKTHAMVLNDLADICKQLKLKADFILNAECIFVVIVCPMFFNVYSALLFMSNDLDTSNKLKYTLFNMKAFTYACISSQFNCVIFLASAMFSKINQNIRKSTPIELDQLRFMVSKVFECCDIANGYFGVFSLMYIIHTSVHIQNNLFEAGKIVCSLLLGQGSLENDTLSIWVRLITALACFLRLLSYVWCTTRLTFESNKMAALLVRVSNEVVCNSLKEQVYWFAEEVRWNKIGFTANGLFNIDRELLFMAAGSCATNMAILLQAYISK